MLFTYYFFFAIFPFHFRYVYLNFPVFFKVFFLNNKTDDEDHLLFYPMVSPDPHSFTTIVKKFPGAGV